MTFESKRIPEEILDIIQENAIFAVGSPPDLFNRIIQETRDNIEGAPDDQIEYVEIGIKVAKMLQYQR